MAAMVDYTSAPPPSPAANVPGTENPTGSAGAADTYRRGDAVQPRISRTKNITLDANGVGTFNWVGDGQPALTGTATPILTPIYSGSAAPSCWATSVSNSAVSVKCVLMSAPIISIVGINVASATIVPASGMQVGVTALPAS